VDKRNAHTYKTHKEIRG